MSQFFAASPNIDFGAVFGGKSADLGGQLGIGEKGKSFGKVGGKGMIGLASGAMGLASAGLNFYGGLKANETARSINQAKMAAASDRLRNEVMMNREAAKFGEASKVGDRVANFGYGADLDLGRQLQAGRIARGEFADMDIANKMRGFRSFRDFEASPETQALEDQRSQRRIREALAGKLAQGRGMFGPIAPVDASSLVF